MEIKNLSFAYSADRLILKNISMTITAGEFVCILGQSGCVKSTFCVFLPALSAPQPGRFFLMGSRSKEPALIAGSCFRSMVFFLG